MENHINLVNVPLDVMTSTIREIVSSELQKVKELISITPKEYDSDLVFTREDVCKLLKVSMTTLYNWNKGKILVNFKVRGRVFYNKSDVLALLNPLKAVS